MLSAEKEDGAVLDSAGHLDAIAQPTDPWLYSNHTLLNDVAVLSDLRGLQIPDVEKSCFILD